MHLLVVLLRQLFALLVAEQPEPQVVPVTPQPAEPRLGNSHGADGEDERRGGEERGPDLFARWRDSADRGSPLTPKHCVTSIPVVHSTRGTRFLGDLRPWGTQFTATSGRAWSLGRAFALPVAKFCAAVGVCVTASIRRA